MGIKIRNDFDGSLEDKWGEKSEEEFFYMCVSKGSKEIDTHLQSECNETSRKSW